MTDQSIIEHKIRIIGTSLGASRNKDKILKVTFQDMCCKKLARDSYVFEKSTGRLKLQSILTVIGVLAYNGKLNTRDMLGKKFIGYIYKDNFGCEVVEPTGTFTTGKIKPIESRVEKVGVGVRARVSMIDWKD